MEGRTDGQPMMDARMDGRWRLDAQTDERTDRRAMTESRHSSCLPPSAWACHSSLPRFFSTLPVFPSAHSMAVHSRPSPPTHTHPIHTHPPSGPVSQAERDRRARLAAALPAPLSLPRGALSGGAQWQRAQRLCALSGWRWWRWWWWWRCGGGGRAQRPAHPPLPPHGGA